MFDLESNISKEFARRIGSKEEDVFFNGDGTGKPLDVSIETGVFKSEAPDTYIVLVPLADTFPLNADNMPQTDLQELRITLFSKGNYIKLKNKITALLLSVFFCITDRRYNGFDTGTGYHQYTIDVAKNYDISED